MFSVLLVSLLVCLLHANAIIYLLGRLRVSAAALSRILSALLTLTRGETPNCCSGRNLTDRMFLLLSQLRTRERM